VEDVLTQLLRLTVVTLTFGVTTIAAWDRPPRLQHGSHGIRSSSGVFACSDCEQRVLVKSVRRRERESTQRESRRGRCGVEFVMSTLALLRLYEITCRHESASSAGSSGLVVGVQGLNADC